jgi:probable aminopeptidase NPEPL1
MPVHTDLYFTDDLSTFSSLRTLVVLGRKALLRDPGLRGLLALPAESWEAMLERTDGGEWGASASTWVGRRKLVAGVLPEACSRHNSPSRAWAIPALARKADGREDAAVVLCVDDPAHAFPAALACARAFPRYSAATGSRSRRAVHIAVMGPDGPINDPRIPEAIEGVRLAAELVDTPTADLHTDAFALRAREVASAVGADFRIIQGEDLRAQGFGGIWAVGKAAVHKPALVVLDWHPAGAKRTVAWVGKGIVYDTGGLSIKTKTGMPGMKGDMGGAAAVLGAFQTAARLGCPDRVVAVLCLAENAVGPESVRPDDIITMKSGRTVEINNTDAEGRLVLADGVAWVAEVIKPHAVVDLATLTGAALVATGRVHAGIYTNDEALERAAVAAGRRAGEPVHPLVYIPELLRKEFKSQVADMKNSVRDRSNAQSSCAGQFIANHLPEPAPPWLHIDLAGPAWDSDDRGTGYGVGLLLELGAGPY